MHAHSSDLVLSTLRELRLRGFDWDGFGGLPLRGDVGDLVHDLYQLSFTEDMPGPVVLMNKDGTIDIEYDADDDRKLFLTFQCDGIITYIKVYGDDETTIEGTIRLSGDCVDLEDFDEVVELFEWISPEF